MNPPPLAIAGVVRRDVLTGGQSIGVKVVWVGDSADRVVVRRSRATLSGPPRIFDQTYALLCQERMHVRAERWIDEGEIGSALLRATGVVSLPTVTLLDDDGAEQ